MKATHKYDDIIDLPHHVSDHRVRMSIRDRAAQFSPFAALTGYDDVILETARLTDFQTDLDEGEKLLLNEKLQRITQMLEDNPRITVTWFRDDDRKSGGAYVSYTGQVKKLDTYEQTVVFTDGTVIPVRLIYHIDME